MIGSILSFVFIKNWKAALLVLAVFSIGGYIKYQSVMLENLRTEREGMSEALDSYVQSFDAIQQAYLEQMETLRKEREDEIAREEKFNSIIQGAGKQLDGPLASVVFYTLDRLYDRETGGKGSKSAAPTAIDNKMPSRPAAPRANKNPS